MRKKVKINLNKIIKPALQVKKKEEKERSPIGMNFLNENK